MTPNPAWQDNAACRHASPELFFPQGRTGQALTDSEAAKAICALCPVQSPCLAFALNTHQEFGIWGGTTEDERRRLLKVAGRRPGRRVVTRA